MGGAAAYTLATALFVGAAGFFGVFPIMFDWLPKAAMFPILVFVGLEITAQSFHATPVKHYPALAFAMLPALAYLVMVPMKQVMAAPVQLPGVYDMLQTLRCLANGFIVTSLIWAAALAMILDGRLRSAGVYFLIAGVLAFFGVIHSPLLNEEIGLPHQIWDKLTHDFPAFIKAAQYQTPYHWAGAYVLVALFLFGLVQVPVKGNGAVAAILGTEEMSAAALPAIETKSAGAIIPLHSDKARDSGGML